MSITFTGKDLTGMIFGRWTVLEFSHRNRHGQAVWKCRCSCAKSSPRYMVGAALTCGSSTSCGCYTRELRSKIALQRHDKFRAEMIGKKFGRLTTKSVAYVKDANATFYNCGCDCGNTIVVSGNALNTGKTSSCGCYRREVATITNTTHGLRDHRLYYIYNHMLGRCYDDSDPSFINYGARGIEVCKEWRDDIKSFHDWAMANGYRDDLTIDRINNDGNYEPANCRWATWLEQARNKRSNVVSGMEMARAIRADNRPSKEVAAAYGIRTNVVNAIRSGKHWKED